MEERLSHLEKAFLVLEGENQRLREEITALQARGERLQEVVNRLEAYLPIGLTEEAADEATSPSGQWKGRLRRRWPLVAVALTIAVPLVALSVWHLDAFWSTAIGFLNGILLYYIGPRAWSLLIEGLFRAIPAVLFGQATRIALEKLRARRSKSSG